ncbi:MAG: hypothetical protein ACT4QF_20760 [Sporichthyaceae bacterium]
MTIGKPRPDENLDEDASYWRSPRTVAAAVVLACTAAAATWAVATGGDGSTEKATAPTAYDSACGLAGGSTVTPAEAPAVQWQNFDGNWLPTSATQGPGVREVGGAWSCYGRTPTGAVLAALTIPGAMNVADDYAAVVRKQTAPGVGQVAAIKAGQPRFTADQTATPLGFVLNSYAEDGSAATVTFYVRARSTMTLRCSTTVQWFGGPTGDWLVRLTSDGNSVSSCERVADDYADVKHFVAWGPNS